MPVPRFEHPSWKVSPLSNVHAESHQLLEESKKGSTRQNFGPFRRSIDVQFQGTVTAFGPRKRLPRFEHNDNIQFGPGADSVDSQTSDNVRLFLASVDLQEESFGFGSRFTVGR
jgi:hypothetical protein